MINSQQGKQFTRINLNKNVANEILENYAEQSRTNVGISIRANTSGEYKSYKIYGKTHFGRAHCVLPR